MLCKKCFCEVNQVGNNTVIGVRPNASKLKAITCLSLLCFAGTCILDSVIPGTIGIILGISSIGDNKNLHIFKQTAARPERVTLITVNLIKGLPYCNASAF
ncbi:hypothetical protein SDC9_150343 [bioreactor metagenome]|uniref:Uncharacterized protein n=1 Tax=bioreactor metagenome TaxID=1076179 RepID=A0A645EP40_9ZZZZ